MSHKKVVGAGEAFTGAARWVNSVWKGGAGGKAALVGVGLIAPVIFVAPALAYCLGTAKVDKENVEHDGDKQPNSVATSTSD